MRGREASRSPSPPSCFPSACRGPQQEGRAKEGLTSEPRVSSLECESTAWEPPRGGGCGQGRGRGRAGTRAAQSFPLWLPGPTSRGGSRSGGGRWGTEGGGLHSRVWETQMGTSVPRRESPLGRFEGKDVVREGEGGRNRTATSASYPAVGCPQTTTHRQNGRKKTNAHLLSSRHGP